MLIFEDADLEQAVNGAAFATFVASGQVSLGLDLSVRVYYSVLVAFYVMRSGVLDSQLWCSIIILYSNTSIAYNHHTDILLSTLFSTYNNYKHIYRDYIGTDMHYGCEDSGRCFYV